jgi:hypothetical protein
VTIVTSSALRKRVAHSEIVTTAIQVPEAMLLFDISSPRISLLAASTVSFDSCAMFATTIARSCDTNLSPIVKGKAETKE